MALIVLGILIGIPVCIRSGQKVRQRERTFVPHVPRQGEQYWLDRGERARAAWFEEEERIAAILERR